MAIRLKKKFNIDSIRTDVNLEKDGVWEDCENGLRLLVARAGNMNYLAELRRLFLEEPEDADNASVIERHILSALASKVLLGWEGVYREMTEEEIANATEEAAKATEEKCSISSDCLVEVPYSFESAYKYLDEVPDFYRLVTRLSGMSTRFKAEKVANQAKK